MLVVGLELSLQLAPSLATVHSVRCSKLLRYRVGLLLGCAGSLHSKVNSWSSGRETLRLARALPSMSLRSLSLVSSPKPRWTSYGLLSKFGCLATLPLRGSRCSSICLSFSCLGCEVESVAVLPKLSSSIVRVSCLLLL